MRKLPFSISLPVLFWGWQTEMLFIAVCIAPFLEATSFIKTKWEFSEQDFNKISDLSTIILAGLLVYYLISDPLKIIAKTLTYLPLIILPILLAQLYSSAGKINIRSLMLFSRKAGTDDILKTRNIDFSYVFIAVCLISAGMGNNRDQLFYFSIICLSFWILYPLRSKRYSPFIWLIFFVISAASGYFTHNQISRLQEVITSYTINYLASKSTNTHHQVTSIGDIGTLKLSNRIISRLEKNSKKPFYLWLSTYTAYRKSKWFATLGGFTKLKADKKKTEWFINNSPTERHHQLKLYTTINEKKILELPKGVTTIKNLQVEQLEKNTLGAVKALYGSGFTACNITYDNQNTYFRAPGAQDTVVPHDQKKIITDYIDALNRKNKIELRKLTTSEKLNFIKNHFQKKYVYSLTQKEDNSYRNPIENFLVNTKAGHCEFFATTAVMLLRELNIPARYATGYLVNEYDASKDIFIVRERDAHAWCVVYVDGGWINVDTTPSNWVDYENEKNAETPIKDLISNTRFIISKWFAERTKEEILRLTFFILLPFGLYLLFRLRPSSKIKRVKISNVPKKQEEQAVKQGLYLIEEKLNNKGYHRYQWETFGLWFERIEKSGVFTEDRADIHEILLLHYNQRYNQADKQKTVQESLNRKINSLLKKTNFSD